MMMTLQQPTVPSSSTLISSFLDGQPPTPTDGTTVDQSPAAPRKRTISGGIDDCRSKPVTAGDHEESSTNSTPARKTFLSVFQRKHKNKVAKTQSVDVQSTSDVHSMPNSQNSFDESSLINEMKTDITVDQRLGQDTTPPLPLISSSGFSARKGFQRCISIPAPDAASFKKSGTFHPGDGYEDFPCKYDCPQTPRTPLQRPQPEGSESADTHLGDVIQALSGPPLDDRPDDGTAIQSKGTSDDKSPLIVDRPPLTDTRLLAVAATSFDNIAALTGVEAVPPSPAPSQASTTMTFFGGAATVEGKTAATSRWSLLSKDSKNAISRKKIKPKLQLPTSTSSSKEPCSGMRQLTAAEERKIDEAMELASKMALMSTTRDRDLPSPRSQSGSSKESLDSPALSKSSSGNFFLFGGVVTRHRLGRNFAEVLAPDAAERMFSSDAQAAYNQLVASSANDSSPAGTPSPTGRVSKRARRYRHQVLEAPVTIRRHHQRSSLSESDGVSLDRKSVV